MERLRMTTVTPASLDPLVENESDPGDLVHNSMAMDEGQRLQRRKNKLISQAETIIHINTIIGAKLQVNFFFVGTKLQVNFFLYINTIIGATTALGALRQILFVDVSPPASLLGCSLCLEMLSFSDA